MFQIDLLLTVSKSITFVITILLWNLTKCAGARYIRFSPITEEIPHPKILEQLTTYDIYLERYRLQTGVGRLGLS